MKKSKHRFVGVLTVRVQVCAASAEAAEREVTEVSMRITRLRGVKDVTTVNGGRVQDLGAVEKTS